MICKEITLLPSHIIKTHFGNNPFTPNKIIILLYNIFFIDIV